MNTKIDNTIHTQIETNIHVDFTYKMYELTKHTHSSFDFKLKRNMRMVGNIAGIINDMLWK